MSVSKKKVAPTGPKGATIMIIGEAPGADEDRLGYAFQGESGEVLNAMLTSAGIRREDCYVTNICNYKPYKNDFSSIIRDAPAKITEGVQDIDRYITEHPPNIIITLGSFACYYLTGNTGIERHRGYLTTYRGIKVLPTYHPAFTLYSPREAAILDLDIKKAVAESKTKEIKFPKRNYTIINDFTTGLNAVQDIVNSTIIAVDIETTRQGEMLCVGFAVSREVAYVFPWNESLIPLITQILTDKVLKIFHNGTFDVMALELYGIKTVGYTDDTMIAMHVLAPELPRSLEFLTSLYTNEPYYKKQGRGAIPEDTKVWGATTDKKDLYIYNAKDCCVTFECWEELMKEIMADLDFRHYYNFEMKSVIMAIDIGLNGLPIDTERRSMMNEAVVKKMKLLSYLVNSFAQQVVNINSTPQLCEFLYNTLALPPRMKQNDKGQSSKTADKDAIAGLIAFAKSRLNDVKTDKSKTHWDNVLFLLRSIAQFKALSKLKSSYLNFELRNGYAISQYKVSATETGRWGCASFFDLGLNAQTFPRGSVVISGSEAG